MSETLLIKFEKIRWDDFNYDNTHDLDFQGKDYLIFDPKEKFVKFHWPKKIETSIVEENVYGNETFRIHGVDYFFQNLVQFAYLNPNLPTEIYQSIAEILNTKCTIPLPKGLVDFLLGELMFLMDTDELEGVVRRNYERAYVFNPKLSKEERKSLKGKAKSEQTKRRRIREIKEILSFWDMKKNGKVTNANIGKRLGLSTRQIGEYGRFVKEEKKNAKKGLSPKSYVPNDPQLFYDVNGVGYNIDYLNNTDQRVLFPISKDYSFSNFGEVYKRTGKKMMCGKDGYFKLNINGTRQRFTLKSLYDEIFFNLVTRRDKPDEQEIEYVFEVQNTKENIFFGKK
ncbi:hypothetical protein ACFSQJ_19325 [Croceitalea marina]|uniref:Uncharacterized protein n=1 Tax=Croceitalea marina TaxID=1775166 RepID=A0ABW5N096_9FLAO